MNAICQSRRNTWNRPFPHSLQKEPTLPVHWFWTSSFYKFETFFFFKPPGGLPCHSKLIVTSMIVIQSISCLTLCNPMKCSMPGFPVPHYVLKFDQTHVQWVSDAIQPFHPLSPPSPPALNLSQHQGLFQWDNFTSSGQYDFKKEERG